MRANGTMLVLLATLGLALKGVWARLAYAEGLSVETVLFYRSALSAPLVVALTFLATRRMSSIRAGNDSASHHPSTTKPRIGDWLAAVGLGLFFSLGMACDFSAILDLGAGVSRVILFGYPLVVMVLSSLQSGRMPTRSRLLGFFLAWVGLLFVAELVAPASLNVASVTGVQSSNPAETGAGLKWEALRWGLASMMAYALYVWLSGKVVARLGSARLTGVSNLATAGAVVSYVLASGSGAERLPEFSGLLWVLVMVVVSTVVPYFLMMEGISRLGSTQASLLSMSGPVVTLVASYLVLNERLSAMQLVGTALTLLGVGVATGKAFGPSRSGDDGRHSSGFGKLPPTGHRGMQRDKPQTQINAPLVPIVVKTS